MGVDGRHKHTVRKFFAYCAHLESVVNSHADAADASDFELRGSRRLAHAMATDVKNMKEVIEKKDEETKRILQ